jgi:hypothetical protein
MRNGGAGGVPGSGFYDEEAGATLDRPLPELEELQLVDVAFEKLVLTEATTPPLVSSSHLLLSSPPLISSSSL